MKPKCVYAGVAVLLFGCLTLVPRSASGQDSGRIQNEGFETGDFTYWTIPNGGASPSPVITNTQVHSGNFSALVGGDGTTTGGCGQGTEPLGDSSFYQEFIVPAGISTLTFWHWDCTTDNILFDWQDAYITDVNGNILQTIFHRGVNRQTWINTVVDMTPYAGQTVRIKFLVHQDGYGDLTGMYLDDVALLSGPPPPSPTPIAVPIGDLLATNNLGNTFSNGGCSIYQYTPSSGPPPIIFGPDLAAPRGIVFDNSSPPNLFVATNNFVGYFPAGTFQGTILKITSSGGVPYATGFGDNVFLEGLAVDSQGNLLVATGTVDPNHDFGGGYLPSSVYKVTSNGTTGTISTFASLPSAAFAVAVDNVGDVYVSTAESTDPNTANGTILRFSSVGTPKGPFVGGAAVFPSSGPGPAGLAFDASGNLFVSTSDNNGNGDIRKFNSTGTEVLYGDPPGHYFAPGLTKVPRGLAFDSAGNLFCAEPGNGGPTPPGDILEFTPGGTPTVFDDGTNPLHHFGTRGNRGPEFLAFPPNTGVSQNSVRVDVGTVGSANTDIALTFPSVTTGGTTMATPIDPASAGYTLPGSSLGFDIRTTAAYPTPVPIPPGIVIAFQVAPPLVASQLTVYHNENGQLVNVTCPSPVPGPTPDATTNTIYASVTSLSPFVVAKVPFAAHVQQPINSDGSSVFNANRGVVPVKFTLTQNGNGTCTLPPATIAVTRTAGGTIGAIDESVYSGAADTGSNFRISSCQYLYNLNSGVLGRGTYRVDIKMGGIVVGSATFGLR